MPLSTLVFPVPLMPISNVTLFNASGGNPSLPG